MKKMKYMPLAALLIFSAACENENTVIDEPVQGSLPEIIISAKIDDSEAGTKTHLDGVKLTWSKNDTILVISKEDIASSYPSKRIGYYEIFEGIGETKAKFKLVKGSAPIDTTSGIFYAMYAPDATFTAGTRGVWTFPEVQSYSADGVADGMIPMYGFGKGLNDLRFDHLSYILRLPLYSNTAATLGRIEFRSTNVMGGQLYHTFYDNNKFNLTANNKSVTMLTCTFGDAGLELSTDAKNPTYVDVVMPALNFASFNITIYSKDGGDFFYKTKKSPLNPGSGVIYKLPVTEVELIPMPNVTIQVGESEPKNIYEYEGTPKGEVKIASPDVVSLSCMERIATIMTKGAESTISLDLSEINLVDDLFSNWLKNCTSLKSIKLPKSLEKIQGISCVPSTIVDTIVVPEGVTYIGPSAFNIFTGVLSLPSTLKTLYAGNSYKLSAFAMQAPSAYFSVMDGVLYNADTTKLLFYPGNKVDTVYVFPSFVTSVGSGCFQCNANLKTIRVHANVQSLVAPFAQMQNLTDIYLEGTSTNLTSITYNDGIINILFKLYGDQGITRTIHAPNGCSYYRNHAIWQKFNTIYKWTFDDGCTDAANCSTTIGELGTSNPSFNW